MIIQDAEGAGADDVCGVTEIESLFILEERQLQGKQGRMGSYSCVQQPKVHRDRCFSEPTTKGQKLRGWYRHKNLQEGNLQLDTGKEKFTMKGVKPWNKSHERR